MIDHTGMIFGNDLGYRFLRKYVSALFDKEEQELVYRTSLYFLNDSYYTVTGLIHTSKEVALASVFLAAKQHNFEIPIDPYYKFDLFTERINKFREPEATPDT